MRLLACWTSVFALLVTAALANTEKAIFVAPALTRLPDAAPGLPALSLDTLTPANSSLRREVAVAFPTHSSPHGLDSWYLLQGLGEGQRYEVRVCWVAIQPTQFWLDVYHLTHVFDTPELIQSLAAFSEKQQQASLEPLKHHSQVGNPATTLFLRLQAAADFFSTNQTLMTDPPLVVTDIILDPYLMNILPASLVPTAAYILALAIIAWYLSSTIWAQLAITTVSKAHAD